MHYQTSSPAVPPSSATICSVALLSKRRAAMLVEQLAFLPCRPYVAAARSADGEFYVVYVWCRETTPALRALLAAFVAFPIQPSNLEYIQTELLAARWAWAYGDAVRRLLGVPSRAGFLALVARSAAA